MYPRSPTVLLELPISIVEGADLACFQPSRNAVKVEGVLDRADILVSHAIRRLVGTRAPEPKEDVRCKFPTRLCIPHW